MRRIVTAAALAFLGCLLSAGLLGAQAQPEAVDPGAELVVAMPDDTQNMDPRLGMGSVRSTYIRQVFESLVDTDPQGRPVPGLAVSWKPVGDNAWEWSLRPNVRFHNGEAFNGASMTANFNAVWKSPVLGGSLDQVASVTQSGPMSMTITLKRGRHAYQCTVDSHAELGMKGVLRVS